MENIKKKLLIKNDKKSSDLINFASSVDETSIIFSGDENDEFLKIIKKSLEESLSITRKIDSEIINMEGLSGRKYRSLINNLIQKIKDPSLSRDWNLVRIHSMLSSF